jgi:hypothetical protein
MGAYFLFASAIAFTFLVYSAINRDKLGISFKHPRIIVEFSLFLIFMVLGLVLL